MMTRFTEREEIGRQCRIEALPMETTRICKKCLLYELGDEESKRILQYQDRILERDRVPEEQFRQRMNICRTCSALLARTCRSCGCYVELRGLVKTSHCPDKKW